MKKIILLLVVISIVVRTSSCMNGKTLEAYAEDNESKSKVVEIPVTQAGKSEIEDLPAANNTSNEFEVVKPQNGSSAASLSSAAPRRFIDVFSGTAKTLDDTVSAFNINSNPRSVSREVHFRPSVLYGVRVGIWLENYPYVGFAGDLSYLQASAPGVRIWYVPLSFVMMGRYPFLKTDTVPDGRLQPYGGVMISRVIGDLEVDFTPEMREKIGGSTGTGGHGVGALVGIAWHLTSYAIFSEFRLRKDSLDFKETSILGTGPDSASADLNTRQIAFGVSYKF